MECPNVYGGPSGFWGKENVSVDSVSITPHPQEPVLFGTTIMENIRFGKLAASDEEVYAAAREANAHEFITSFPEGYNTIVGRCSGLPGTRWSGIGTQDSAGAVSSPAGLRAAGTAGEKDSCVREDQNHSQRGQSCSVGTGESRPMWFSTSSPSSLQRQDGLQEELENATGGM